MPKSRTMTELLEATHNVAVNHGWWDGVDDVEEVIPEKLLLIISEVSEATEEYRNGRMETYFAANGKPEGFFVELGDAVIRIFDLCGKLGVDLSEIIELKNDYNETRPYRHGGKRI